MYKEIKKCRICSNSDLIPLLDLGDLYLTGVFPKKKNEEISSGPIQMVKCNSSGKIDCCGLVQLKHSFDQNEMYGDNYGYRSGLNHTMVEHLRRKVKKILSMIKLKRGDIIIDIGSNDCTLLNEYPLNRYQLIGIDPALRTMKKEYSRLSPKSPTTVSLILQKHRDKRYYENGSGWRSKEGSVFLNQGIHWLDIMNWFFGTPLECTSKAYITRSFLECADLGVALLCYPNNTFAVIQGGTFSRDQNTEKFSIVHSDGIIDYKTILDSERHKLGLIGVSQKALRRLKVMPQIKDASLLMLEDFCESIINDRKPEVSLKDGYNALILGEQLCLLSDRP